MLNASQRWLTTAALVAALCAIAACGSSGSKSEREATWYGGIQPLLVERCGACHTGGGIGPFPLDEYDSASRVAALALDAIEAGIMPPWGAHDTDECTPPLPWKGDQRLSDDDKKLLSDWIAAGTPEGDPATALPVPPRPSLELEDATHTMEFQQPFDVTGDRDIFECFVLDPQTDEDLWLTGVQFNPGNPLIDHHALVFMDPGRQSEQMAVDGHFPCFGGANTGGLLVGAWAPGALPFEPPPTSGVPMPAGSLIVVQMHYHPTGIPEVDLSSVSLRTTTEQPAYEAALALLGNFDSFDEEDGGGLMPGDGDGDGDEPEFLIPAGAKNHVETMVFNHQLLSVPIFAVGAHMHYVGVDMKIDLRRRSGDDACLLQTPRWDFEWQRAYSYDAPIDELPTMEAGDSLVMRCTYDNTMENPGVVQAVTEQGLTGPVDVELGDETLDEMCLGVFGVLLPPGFLSTMM